MCIRDSYHAVGLFPLAWLLFDYWFGLLGPEPIRAMILRTGKAAIILLTLSLVCTPAGYLFRWRDATTVRRPLGLYAFMYVCLHLLIFIGLDYAFILPLVVEEIVERRYALVGFAAFLLLVPLAVTSTKGWQKRLGKRWKVLHKPVSYTHLDVYKRQVQLVTQVGAGGGDDADRVGQFVGHAGRQRTDAGQPLGVDEGLVEPVHVGSADKRQ